MAMELCVPQTVSIAAFALFVLALAGVFLASVLAAAAFGNVLNSYDERRTAFQFLFLHLAEPWFTLPWMLFWTVLWITSTTTGGQALEVRFGTMMFATLPMTLLLLPIAVFWGDRDASNWAHGMTLLGAGRWVVSAALMTTLDLKSRPIDFTYVNYFIIITGTLLLYGCCYCAHRLFSILERNADASAVH